jgi:cytochrome c556
MKNHDVLKKFVRGDSPSEHGTRWYDMDAIAEEFARMREHREGQHQLAVATAEENRRIADDIWRLTRLLHEERAENAKFRDAIERVRALHAPVTRAEFGVSWQLCEQCHDGDGYLLVHPCPTLRALDGDA